MCELTDTNELSTSNLQRSQPAKSVLQVGDETKFVPTNESQISDEPSSVIGSTEVTKAEASAIFYGTAGREGVVGELQRRLETPYMRRKIGISSNPGSPNSLRGSGMAHKWGGAGHGDPTAQGVAGPDFLDSPTGTANAPIVAGLSDSPRVISGRSQKCEGVLESEIPDRGPLPAEQKAPAISSLTSPSHGPSFSESAPKDPQGFNIMLSSQACEEGSSSPVAGSSPVLISSPLLAAKCSRSSTPAPRVSSQQLSSPIMVPSSPMTSSSPVSSPPSSFILVVPENAIPELLLTEPGEIILGTDIVLNGCPATGSEALISPRCLTVPVGPEPSEADKIQKVKRRSPPNPKHPTAAGQRKEHEKLSKPFRPPCPTKLKSDNPSHSTASNLLDELHNKTRDDKRSIPTRAVAKVEVQKAAKQQRLTEEETGNRHRTMRAAAQFKSPVIPTGTNPQASPTSRLTPAIQMLERKLQILKRATKAREENEEDVLRGLITKWTGAGREVAWEVWTIVRDNIRDGPDHSYATISGKRSFQDSWSWEMRDDKRHKIEEDYPHSMGQNEAEETETMESVGLVRVPAATEDPDGPHHTLGTMLRQLGIDPQILGWDDEEEIFKEVDDEV